MKLLLLCDDLWHPGEAIARGLRFLRDHGHEVDVVMDAKDIVTPEMLREADAVIIAKSDSLNGANASAPWFEEGITLTDPEAFRRYVEEGGALLVLHAGATFRTDSCPVMSSLLGTSFIGHPPQCPVSARILHPEHPICRGVTNFEIRQDEHYQIELTDDQSDVLFETVSAAGAQPAGLAREIGRGRVCVFTPGHNAYVFDVPQYRRLILNALLWITDAR